MFLFTRNCSCSVSDIEWGSEVTEDRSMLSFVNTSAGFDVIVAHGSRGQFRRVCHQTLKRAEVKSLVNYYIHPKCSRDSRVFSRGIRDTRVS